MAYGILFLRVVVGGLLFAHGTQKLFGWWGGGVLVASLVGGAVTLAMRELQPETDATEAPLARERDEERIGV
jgi:uncharacterized membrane protein YphA (DoxX/SURF4 family)